MNIKYFLQGIVLCNLQQPVPFFSSYPNFLSFARLWSSRDLHNACTLSLMAVYLLLSYLLLFPHPHHTPVHLSSPVVMDVLAYAF